MDVVVQGTFEGDQELCMLESSSDTGHLSSLNVRIISEHGVLGYIRVSLQMHTDLGSGSEYSQKKSQVSTIFFS